MKTLTRKIYHIAAAMLATGVSAGCADDYLILAGDPGRGEGDVTLTVSCDTFGDDSPASRAGTAGDAIGDISDVSVLAYHTDGTLASAQFFTAGAGLEMDDSPNRPSGSEYDNDRVRRGTMTLRLPYGRYRIYAVANMGDIAASHDVTDESAMRALTFGWDGADIAANRQMCGLVTQSGGAAAANRTPPVVTVGRDAAPLHAWLERAASKATIAYDATELNNSIYIYIISAQVRDIPARCTLVDENVPQTHGAGDAPPAPDRCLVQGQTIDYLQRPGDHESSRVVLARGSAYGGLANEDALVPGQNVHTTAEESLFFYENMQGKHENKHIYNNFPEKDDVIYGSYLEVKAYYLNKSANNPSKGEITYRYMLGMNDTDDFNARRNTHFKVTLRFVGDANNPDWHIDYTRPTVPTVEVPTPLHISYLYNQRLDVPVACYHDRVNYRVKSVKAEILDNPYTHSEHPYSAVTSASFASRTWDWTQPRYGFLSFTAHPNITSIDMTQSSTYSGSTEVTEVDPGAYDETAKATVVKVPVYTRPLNLMVPNGGTLTDLGFSGNNHFTHRERKARMRVTVEYVSLANTDHTTTATTEIDIVQVKRVVNPKGCWRPHDSVKPFTFTLMETDQDATNISSIEESAVSYRPIRSDGAWTARVYTEDYGGGNRRPGVDWIELSPKGRGAWRSGPDAAVTGSTNSTVEFDFRPASTIGAGQTRFGVIEVLYHDNQCRHLIFVSQGYGTVRMGTHDWMMGNLHANGQEVDNPLLEGSMFKYGNAETGLLASNNYTTQTPDCAAGPFKDASTATMRCARRTYSAGAFGDLDESYTTTFGAIPANLTKGFTGEALSRSSRDGGTYRVATYADYRELLDTDRFGTLFGVLYGQELSHTPTTDVDRYTVGGDPSGMRGCFVYDRATGNHLFLPVGNTGIGRRKAYYKNGTDKRYAVLKYANRDGLMDAATARPRPLMYDIYRKPGALYWFRNYETVDGAKAYALDINYFTYLLNVYSTQVLYYYGSSSSADLKQFRNTGTYPRPSSAWADQNSDAAFVRRIRL